jgi:deoxyribodipyrimidine photo-lyase
VIISLSGATAVAVVERHLPHLVSDRVMSSPSIRGGQTAANTALHSFDVAGYAARRSRVLPDLARGASRLSPYIRHGLLSLREVWNAAVGPEADVTKFRDELLWQEFARHLYARVGTRLQRNLRFDVAWSGELSATAWPREMACVNWALTSLESDGWLVNQTRLWLASQYTVRSGAGWMAGQEYFHRHLLDGSRAANLLGWQWTVGAGTGKPYGFARWQVENQAPQLCSSCPLNRNCPIQNFAPDQPVHPVASTDLRLRRDDNLAATRGPSAVMTHTAAKNVVLTIESLGDDDPALVANPTLPVHFIFDEPALAKLQLSSKRMVFYIETLRDLAERRNVVVHLGDPLQIAPGLTAAITWAPVPSFEKYATAAAELHPWPWLVEPHAGSVKSYSAWRQKIDLHPSAR